MDCDNQEIEATKNMKEKTADEMFEELGYEKYNEYVYINYHTKNEDKDIEFATIIEFDEDKKTFYKDNYGSIGDITMQELKAINQKVLELRMVKKMNDIEIWKDINRI